MDKVPRDIKQAIGKIVVLLTVSTDPAHILRLTRSLMSLTKASLNKSYGGPQHLPKYYTEELKIRRAIWDDAISKYASSSETWPTAMSHCGDIADYLIMVCIDEGLIEIDDNDFCMTDALNRGRTGGGEPDDE